VFANIPKKASANGEKFKMKIKVTVGVCMKNCGNDVRQIVDRISAKTFHTKTWRLFS
jgi:hypothetical protein